MAAPATKSAAAAKTARKLLSDIFDPLDEFASSDTVLRWSFNGGQYAHALLQGYDEFISKRDIR